MGESLKEDWSADSVYSTEGLRTPLVDELSVGSDSQNEETKEITEQGIDSRIISFENLKQSLISSGISKDAIEKKEVELKRLFTQSQIESQKYDDLNLAKPQPTPDELRKFDPHTGFSVLDDTLLSIGSVFVKGFENSPLTWSAMDSSWMLYWLSWSISCSRKSPSGSAPSHK